ncbi:MAG: hypothetical protein HUJ54_09510 [Erysipelotrichaceae bacterium]|nr:hypothetical protein [Erysipelotrichaceae bacterium]
MKKFTGKAFAAAAIALACSLSLTACGNNSSSSSTAQTTEKELTDAEIKKQLSTQLSNLDTKSWSADVSYTNTYISGVVLTEKTGYDENLKMNYEDCSSETATFANDVPEETRTIVDQAVDLYKQLGTLYMPVNQDVLYIKADGKLVKVEDVQQVATIAGNSLAKSITTAFKNVKVTEATDTTLVIDRNAEFNGEKYIGVGYAGALTTNQDTGAVAGVIFLLDPATCELKAAVAGDGAAAQYKVTTTVTTKSAAASETDTEAVAAGEVYLFTFNWGQGADASAEDFNKADVNVDLSEIVNTITQAAEYLKNYK